MRYSERDHILARAVPAELELRIDHQVVRRSREQRRTVAVAVVAVHKVVAAEGSHLAEEHAGRAGVGIGLEGAAVVGSSPLAGEGGSLLAEEEDIDLVEEEGSGPAAGEDSGLAEEVGIDPAEGIAHEAGGIAAVRNLEEVVADRSHLRNRSMT